MTGPRELLHRLLDYIQEQTKDVDPRAYRISAAKGFVRRREDIAGLPGVEFDLKITGDHIWLRVPRLEATKAPNIQENYKGLFRISNDPDGPPPMLDEAAVAHHINEGLKEKAPEERKALEARSRGALAQELEAYANLWRSWAEGERPRRKTISLYGDLFALREALEFEETARPQEFLWGIGIASWMLNFESSLSAFEYPLFTQAIEVSLDEKTMTIELRPRATDTRVEFDAFVACQVAAAAEGEHTAKAHLARTKERPVTPFDPSSYTDVLKLAATNLDGKGKYLEVVTKGEPVPEAGEHLVVTDAWVLFSRPRSNNYLFEDLKRLQQKLESGCDIPSGPMALVTPPSDKPVEFEVVRFRGLSSRGVSGDSNKADELFFPLPYNDEQITIVQRLERAPGVCVQGPPGTGKTHTIANIICHYLV